MKVILWQHFDGYIKGGFVGSSSLAKRENDIEREKQQHQSADQ